MNLSLNDEQLRTVISGAVLQMLTPENREALIKEALVHILTPVKSTSSYSYRDPTSPLQDAFNSAAFEIARSTCIDMLRDDETIKSQIRALIAKAVENAMADSDAIALRLGRAVSDLLSRKDS